MKLRGRTEAPPDAEGAQFLSARGAKPQAPHGPLQRLLDGNRLTVIAKPPRPALSRTMGRIEFRRKSFRRREPATQTLTMRGNRQPGSLGSPRRPRVPRSASRAADAWHRSRRVARVSVWLPSNGEVEGPHGHAGLAPRAHTVPRRPRRQTDHASRTPPTIVRGHLRWNIVCHCATCF